MTTNKWIKVVLLALFVASTTISLPERAGAAAHLPVTVYDNSPYGGASQEFDIGNYDVSDLVKGVGNDKMSAIRIAPGYKVTLYKDAGYKGDSRVYTEDQMYLDGFNDVASSLKVEKISPVDANSIPVPGNSFSDGTKRELLQTFAPRIWMAQNETYMPSSVDFFLPNMDRYLNTSSGKYELKTKVPLNPYTLKLPFFNGDLANAPVYSFWVEKEYNNVDLVYFQFTPYDAGKTVLGTQFGLHVGDWERITVRLAKFIDNGINYVKPVQVYYGYHAEGKTYNWSVVEKVNGTHAVGYSASGSHGMWKDAGNHVYQNIVIAQLTDVCNQGTAWDTWKSMQAFEYFPSQSTGRGLGNAWPEWLDKDYTNPNSGSVYRFGNPEQGSVFGQPMQADGPTGPQDKTSLTDGTILN